MDTVIYVFSRYILYVKFRCVDRVCVKGSARMVYNVLMCALFFMTQGYAGNITRLVCYKADKFVQWKTRTPSSRYIESIVQLWLFNKMLSFV